MSAPASPSPGSSPSSLSSENSQPADLSRVKIKTEDGTDEVKIFSASAIIKHEIDDDVDVDGIEDRLSPVVEEPQTSPIKSEATHQQLPAGYPSPFLYPYFHPMWNPYLMAAAAQAGSASEKSSADGQHNSPYGATPPFPGMSFPGLFPPGMPHHQFQFNPFGIPIPTAGLRPPPGSHRSHQGSSSSSSVLDRSPKDLNTLLESKRPRKPHIKKPLNAFMIYMKEQRARVIEECTLKESSAINKVLGQKWKELSRSEQDRYYELAKEERNRHMQLYPGWSARDNYGIKKKRPTIVVNNPTQKKFIREHHQSPQKPPMKNATPLDNDCSTQKKCRARYGLEGLNQWCKHCRRKKKCTRFLEDDQGNSYPGSSFHQGDPSTFSSPTQSDNDDSLNDLDSDDILARQIDSIDDEHDESDEENQQTGKAMHPVPAQFHPSQFFPGFSY